MTTLLAQPAFQIYAIACAVLTVLAYGIGFYTAKRRAELLQVINHEDASTVNRGARPVDVEPAEVLRIKRAHANLMENFVPFAVIGFLYTQTNPSMPWVYGLFGAFVALRIVHTLAYLSARQPFRTLSFVLAGLLNLTMVVQVLRAVL